MKMFDFGGRKALERGANAGIGQSIVGAAHRLDFLR